MNILSVSQLNRYVKSVLESDPRLGEVFVRGEISSLSAHAASGHLYFALKEGGSVVRAVMFKGNAAHLRFSPQNGLSVLVRGQATLYERDGAFQLSISDMQLDGLGAMYVAFEKLRVRLEAEGLFAAERKQPLPAMPSGIGVLTSASGAALQDIINVLSRRYPVGKLVVMPAFVQGDQAVLSLIKGLNILEQHEDCDVIIMGRGGGSMEDLWAFNEEPLVRAVAACQKPVISAVGHETDFTLCDFAADVRAPTPSAAAEMAAPDLSALPVQIAAIRRRMGQLMYDRIGRHRTQLAQMMASPLLIDISGITAPYREQTAYLNESIGRLINQTLADCRQTLMLQAAALDAMSPLKTIGRGYTLTTDTQGRFFTGTYRPGEGTFIRTRFSWGETESTITKQEVYHGEKTEL